MTAAAVSEPRSVTRTEPDLTPDEVLSRAEAIAATLPDRQEETERRTFYAEDTHQAFADAGLYRLLVPRRFGGHELGIDTFFQVARILTRGCPSTGWMYCLGAVHALAVATLFGEEAQAEVFGGGDFICPATIMPTGAAERSADGEWIVSGTWAYCSGSPYATHFLGHALVGGEDGQEPAPMLFLAARDQFTRLDDWGAQLGLKGSGSHSIKLDGARIPAHLTVDTHLSQVDVTGGTAGLGLHGNPQYGGGQLSLMILEGAVLAVGMAQAALDAYDELMPSRTTMFPPIVGRTEDPDYQNWYGEATGLIATAEAATVNAIQQWQDGCRRGPAAFTRELELRIALICRESVKLCWRAVERHLFPTAGSSSVRNGARLERVWRDMSMHHTHAGYAIFLETLANRELTRARFGVEPADAPH